jgi:hypothetical protein
VGDGGVGCLFGKMRNAQAGELCGAGVGRGFKLASMN